MKTKRNKLLALLLTLVMVLGMLSTTAMADVEGNKVRITEPENATLSSDGVLEQTLSVGTSMTPVIFTANPGYYFPHSSYSTCGIDVTVTPEQITVSGTPEGDGTHVVEIQLKNNYDACKVDRSYNTPDQITQNGVTATVTYSPESSQVAGTAVTATVTLTGTATAQGTHIINLNSIKAGLAGMSQNIAVTAEQDSFDALSIYTFTVPEQDVDDLTLTHIFLDSSTSAAEHFAALQNTEIYKVYSDSAVTGGNPTQDNIFTLTTPAIITGIWTYHWDIGAYAGNGKISLRNTVNSTVYGPWTVMPAGGSGRDNVNWYVFPNETLPAGTYKIVDSDNATWSYASDTGGKGITIVKGIVSEATPTATIDYAAERLTGLMASAAYTVNGVGKTADAAGKLSIENAWFGTTLSIVKRGNGTTTMDSAAQSLAVSPRLPLSYDDYEPSYAITASAAEHGSVSLSKTNAYAGNTVTITTKPDTGYTLETLSVTDKNGKEIALTENADGTRSFKMPAGKVEIKATFMEDNTMLNYFVDVPVDAYYYDAVLWAVKEGITEGTSATDFSPSASCTRAQVVTFLWRAAGCPEPTNAASFSDVDADTYYAKAVAWAAEQSITGGTGATMFSPDDTCTRGQIAAFLYRFAGSPVLGGAATFDDVATDAYYASAVTWAKDTAVTGGTSATTFSPDDTCTRGQIVTFLYRYFVK